VLRQGEDVLARVAAAPRLLDCETDDEAIGPCLEAFWVPQVGQLLPGRDQRLLERVFGAVSITSHADRDCIQPIRGQPCQRGERLGVTSLRGCHEFGLHHAFPLVIGS
jgi:hypothetical protein